MERSIDWMREKARNIRHDIVEMMWRAGSGHVGGSLSVVEILVALYYGMLRIQPSCSEWEQRDRVVLSKGHAAACLYAILADMGFFDRKWLWTEFIKTGRRLSEHPDMKRVPGVDMSTGSLGQGVSAALGMAWAARYLRRRLRVYAIMGCGEQQEGQVWEAAMAASAHRLGNLIGIVDYNDRQVSGTTTDVLNINPLSDKYHAFGWHVAEADGHDIGQLLDVLRGFELGEKPHVIIAHTTKGKGVSFMEGAVQFHATTLTQEQYDQAIRELKTGDDTC